MPDLLQRKNRGKLTPGLLRKNSSEPGRLDIQEKGKKHQKMEGIILYDVVAEIEDDDLSSAPFFIQGFLETRAIALALTTWPILWGFTPQHPQTQETWNKESAAQLRAKLQENGSFLTER